MKKYFSLILVLLFTTFIFDTAIAQVSIGSSVSPTNLYVTKIKESEFDYLKNTTTYFIVPKVLDYDKIKDLISSIWTFNDMVFIPQEDYNEDVYMVANNSIIKIDETRYSLQKSSTGSTVNSWFAYKFEMISYPSVRITKKGKKDEEIFRVADIFFTESLLKKYKSSMFYSKSKVKFFGDEPDYYNFDYGYIKNYFQILNDKLNKKEMLNVRDGIENTEKLKKLKDQKLYVPEWMINVITGLNKPREHNDILTKYEHPYELISSKSLNDKILSGEKFYYLMYSQFNEYKLLSVTDSATGEMIYLVEHKGYKIKKSDIKDLNKLIK